MKALEKDRTRRYETANGFARDIQRYLDGDPVEACPPSASYKLRKFARKHRAALATAGASLSSWSRRRRSARVWRCGRIASGSRAVKAEIGGQGAERHAPRTASRWRSTR